ncbi:class I SAM-dependent methyltransferase [Pelagibius sp.]|uniref:class I SAM-dependent methyltransferase n=1 Tax=Pelagibius sp. TaxID=1931238 RepID=UPI0026095A6D|nr:class I SAM-dependent methyltransferase [Pelagibius sp.]
MFEGEPLRLADLASGPGALAQGFSPYVSACLLVDAEPEMLAVARRGNYKEPCEADFLCASVEDLPLEVGVFDIVTIGRALHWLPHQATRATLQQITKPGGHVLICEAGTFRYEYNPWHKDFNAVRQRYTKEDPFVGSQGNAMFFSGSSFRWRGNTTIIDTQMVSIDKLIERAFSYSSTARDVLGDQAAAMEADLQAALRPHARDGLVQEVIYSAAQVFVRD